MVSEVEWLQKMAEELLMPAGEKEGRKCLFQTKVCTKDNYKPRSSEVFFCHEIIPAAIVVQRSVSIKIKDPVALASS